MLNHVRPRTASASTQQARQRAGAWRFVRCFSGFESQCFSAREHPREVVGQLIRHPRRLRVFHASRAHVHPPHVAVCVPLSRLRAHLRPYPTTAHPPAIPAEAHRSVGGAWACVAVRRVVLGHQGVGSARWCVLGGAVCHRPRRNVRRSTERECRSVQRARHPPARPPRRLGVASGGAFRSFGVCIAATGRPRSVCTSPRENEDGGSDGIALLPRAPRPAKCRYKPA